MNDLEKYALRRIAMEYEVPVRQLTIGQIEDFLAFEDGLNADESLAKKESNKETVPNEKERSKERVNPKEITEKEKSIYINNKNAQIDPNLSTNDKIDLKMVQSEFDDLWSRYPRKQGKKDALRHYTTARKCGISYETISNGLDAYIDYIRRNGIEKGFIKYGSSWFCEWSWDDDYSETYSRGRGQNLTDEEAERIAREVLYGSEDIN
jgi:hypothetical protein